MGDNKCTLNFLKEHHDMDENTTETQKTIVSKDVLRHLEQKDEAIRLLTKKIRQLEKHCEKLRERDVLKSKRISRLESENEQLRKDRASLATKYTLLSHKFDMNYCGHENCSIEGSTPSQGWTGIFSGGSNGVGGGASINGTLASHHGNVASSRARRKAQEGERLKRSRVWTAAYELSADLHDKQLEMLERKYGGALRARRAARIIQQAYRQYCMNKNFSKLRLEAEERRLSRRFAEFGRSKTMWSESANNLEKEVLLEARFHSSEEVRGVEQRRVQVMHKSYSLHGAPVPRDSQQKFQRTLALDLSTINEHTPRESPRQSAEMNIPQARHGKDVFQDLNDSSASDSPQGTPVEPHIDLPSVNFESLLETKVSEILNDSFHSDSSQDTATPHDPSPLMSPVTDSKNAYHTGGKSYENFHNQYSDSSLRVAPQRNATEKAGVRTEACRIPIHGAGAVYTKVPLYDNSEVRLRKQRCSQTQGRTCSTVSENNTTHSHTASLPSGHFKPHKSGNSETSPIWKRKSSSSDQLDETAKRMSNISEASEGGESIERRSVASLDERGSRDGLSSQGSDCTSLGSGGGDSGSYAQEAPIHACRAESTATLPRVTDRERKRAYRIGLNLFNKKPEKGVRYLMEHRFLDCRPDAVARFLIQRKGLSKQMIGEYLGNLQRNFNQQVLESFAEEIDLSGLQIDMALRKFQSYFRMPGEAQKIERLMEAFAQRYCCCNPEQVKQFRNLDTVFLLAFAIIMLNTDLHNRSVKPERKMKLPDFVRNLRGIDDREDIDPDLLQGIYERVKTSEFMPGSDHVTQVAKVEQVIVGKRPQLAVPHRRLVCYIRLYEVHDPNKKEKLGLHQREVFLFNDQLMITKIFSKKKSCVTYSFRQSFMLNGMQVYLFETPHYKYGIRMTTNIDGKVLATFNARNEHDRSKFVEDLKEAILEMNEMENQRIAAAELQRQRQLASNRHSKDSGVGDMEAVLCHTYRLSAPECSAIKKHPLSNSLIDLTQTCRRGSGGSLDSGMASEGRGSQEDNSRQLAHTASAPHFHPAPQPGTTAQHRAK